MESQPAVAISLPPPAKALSAAAPRIIPRSPLLAVPVNPQVPGSSPGRGANVFLHLGHSSRWPFAFSGIEIEKVRRSLLEVCIAMTEGGGFGEGLTC